jgi:hypothetical protein
VEKIVSRESLKPKEGIETHFSTRPAAADRYLDRRPRPSRLSFERSASRFPLERL